MLLAASDEAHTVVELLSPPAGAVVGERVVFGGPAGRVPGEPDSENKLQKKKVWEALAPELRTTAGGVAAWRGLEATTSAGPVTATLTGARVS